ncbi:hypothetical protein BDV97DRAFT_342533 [Delphinella strobiligena]|nr:hypothetical protein BDV97DRAFT_342533 [Delphinella strobiligena]
MTSTATCTVHTVDTYASPASYSSPFGFSACQSLRSTVPNTTTRPRHARTKSEYARMILKRNPESRDSTNMNMAMQTREAGLESNHDTGSGSGSGSGSNNAMGPQWASAHTHTHRNWLKRLSSLSTSSSSRQSSPQPASAVVSQSNGSLASASTTPIVANQHVSANVAPNKLVKRSASLRGPIADTSDSKIPKPSLRRPATSHQRSATVQEGRLRHIEPVQDLFSQSSNALSDEAQWRSYFTPSRRRNSTGIPNPIKRVLPDRRYRPTLVSTAVPVARAIVEYDDEADDEALTGRFHTLPLRSAVPVAPRPSTTTCVPAQTINQQKSNTENSRESDPDSRRPFSVSDWLPSDTQQWRRPSSRASVAKYRRRGQASSSTSVSNEDPDFLTETHNLSISGEHGGLDASFIPSAVESNPSLSPSTTPLVRRRSRKSPAQDSRQSLTVPSFSHQSTPSTEHLTDVSSMASENARHSDDKERSEKDNMFSSTKMPRHSPNRRGPAIDTIFQESPPPQMRGRHILLKDILQHGSFQDHAQGLRPRHSVIHEEDLTATPERPKTGPSNMTLPSPTPQSSKTSTPDMLPSSPPEMPSLLQLRHKRTFDDTDDDQESSWSFGEDDAIIEADANSNSIARLAHLGIAPDFLSPFPNQTSSATTTPQRSGTASGIRQGDKEARSNIFDWSEQQPLDRSPGTHSPPRPKTVHGKKDAENRGSRSVGRRAPSGLHVRSQSVPVVQEADGKRVQVVTNKFGTWGVGSKGVTEDWNEDFDFGEVQPAVLDERRLDSGIGMLVPKSIREQQTNVLANIGLLRDWGILIEEIKELRMRAMAQDLVQSSEEPTWHEVEAMIDLADQESDEHTLAPLCSPPSSPSFNYDAFEDLVTVGPSSKLPVHVSPHQSFRTAESHSTSPLRGDTEVRIIPATPRRPRKDSEAIARSVIEALQQHRVPSDRGPLPGRSEKVHFDTATLRRIIPYVQDLRDRVKGILREAEGLYASPLSLVNSAEDLSFSDVFKELPASPTVRRKVRRSTNTTDNVASDDGFQGPSEDFADRFNFITLV